MVGNRYKAHKDNVIDLFNNYKAKRGSLADGVDVELLERRVNSLKSSKFTLAVAGEVKAGKSTFLNALMGAEILPSDVLQSSSAIVEIFKSETLLLNVTYADGREESIGSELKKNDITNVNEKLHKICKIHDEYRGIPTMLIDDCIIASDSPLIVDNVFVKRLAQQAGEDLQEKYGVIERYISERTKDKIPVKIEFGYPLEWEFDELRVVDCPGVNAIGGVQDIAFRFFEEANAILFVHPIKPIESESFRKFVGSVISNRSKETLFLILTHAGLFSNDEVERLRAEAGRLYEKVIPESRILVVDSLLKLIHCDLVNGFSVEDIKKFQNKKKILSSYREQAEEEKRNLIDVVYESSRFAEMFAALDKFSMKAPGLQLQEILEKIKEGYEEQENKCTEKAERLEKKKRNPQEFEMEIERITDALERYKLTVKQIEEDLRTEYSGKHSSWQKGIDELSDKYSRSIAESDNIEGARKNFIDGLDTLQEKVDGFLVELTQRLRKILEEKGKPFKEIDRISIPAIDLDALEEKAKNNSYRDEDKYETHYERRWYTLWLVDHEQKKYVGKTRKLDKGAFLNKFKDSCKKDFDEIFSVLRGNIKKTFGFYLEHFSKETGSLVNERQKELEKEKEKKQLNAEVIEEIRQVVRKKKDIEPEKKRCIELLREFK